jgi:hypothetical protein
VKLKRTPPHGGVLFSGCCRKSSTPKEFDVAFPIALLEDGAGSYRFRFASKRGELSGRVTVGVEGPPDRRSDTDREQAARNQILAISREFAEACEQ